MLRHNLVFINPPSIARYTANLADDVTWTGSVWRYNKSKSPSYATPKCVFYDHTLSEWSLDGCERGFTNETHVTCCCNHLTSFAVLVSGDDVSEDDGVAVLYITWVGLGASLICLTMTALVAMCSSSMRAQLR